MKKLLCLFSLICLSTTAWTKTYYIKPSGNDALSGLSITNAWQTIGKINSTDFNIGDTLLFEGGSTFIGNIYLSEEDSASMIKPLFISTYGTGRATISAGRSFGLYAYNVGTMHIHNMNFTGLHPDSSNNSGIYFYTDNTKGKKYKNIHLSDLNISNFQTGIQLGSWHNTYPGYSNIRIENVRSEHNLKDGFSSYDMAEKTSSLYAHDSLYMNHCYFGNNGFSGLVIGGVNEGTIERVKSSRSGQLHNKGVVGIWAWSSRKLTFQYCIADSTLTDGGDGGGFDLDGGTENCIIQYCYSFYNDGPGYMHCDYPQSRTTQNNIIRYNISEYDGQQAYRDKSSLLFVSWGTGLNNCLLYNNTSIIGNKANGIISGLQGFILDGYDIAPKINQCKAFNNIVYANGDSNIFTRIYNGKAFNIDTNALQFAYNVYFSSKVSLRKWRIDNSIYNNLNDWRSVSKQEIFKTRNVGWVIDPQLKMPGTGGAIQYSQIDSLSVFLEQYTLLKSSPIIDSGLDINGASGKDIGKFDFFGNSSLIASSQDIGCHESNYPTSIVQSFINRADLSIYPNPCSSNCFVDIGTLLTPNNYTLINSTGQTVMKGIFSDPINEIQVDHLADGIYFLKLSHGLFKTIEIKR